MLRAWLLRFAGLLVGASIAALAASWLGPYPWWAMAMPLLAGNGLAAALLALALLPLCAFRATRERLAPLAAWTWTGFALGVVPVPAASGLLDPPLAHWIGGALALALAAVAWRGRFPAPPARLTILLALLAVPVALAFAFHHDHRLEATMARLAQTDALLPASPATSAAAPSGAPDVILISVDTLRADAIVGERPPGYEIPWFDALRAAGLWWDYALSSSNQTVPGHAGMLMGCDAMGTGVRWNRDLLPGAEHAPLLGEHFLAAGYRTLGVISNDLLSGGMGFRRGFELYDDSTVPRLGAVNEPLDWLGWNSWLGILLDSRWIFGFLIETQYYSARRPPRSLGGHGRLARGSVTTDQTLAALEQAYAQQRPFFFFVHYFDPHQPYGAPPPYAGRLTAGLPPVAPAYAASKKHGMFGKEQIARVAADLLAKDPELRQAARAAVRYYHLTYLERIMFLDAELARLQARLDASGRPYVLLLTADHGEHFGEHDAMLHGQTLWEEVIRVPMILHGAGIPRGVHGTGVPGLEDVAPTLLALAGVAPPESLRGRILHREGAGDDGREHVATDDDQIAWRLGGWKALGRWTSAKTAAAEALFQIATDPLEQLDRFAEGLPQSLGEALDALLARNRYENRPHKRDYGLVHTLGELGYTEAAQAQER